MSAELFTVRNVNEALPRALAMLQHVGIKRNSRAGEVIEFPGPVLTTYQAPEEIVLWSRGRIANPYFHLFEALWQIAGRNDLAWPMQFNARMKEFSDDGKHLRGAYGARWRHGFGRDQLRAVEELLRAYPDSRRAVLTAWDPSCDQDESWVDTPCNTQVYIDRRDGRLNLMACARSNDIWWGAYGANSVLWGVLQQYLAAKLQCPTGLVHQLSYNLHLYPQHAIGWEEVLLVNTAEDRYKPHHRNFCGAPEPLIQNSDAWDVELIRFLDDPEGDTEYTEVFFDKVAAPMYASWKDRRRGVNDGRLAAQAIVAVDWREACLQWIDIVSQRKEAKAA